MITRIVGSPFDEVAFSADGYLQLWFGFNPLTAYAPLEVERRGRKWAVPGPGGRDALCAALGAKVTAAEASEVALSIALDDGSVFRFALDRAPAGEEYAAELDDPDITTRLVWRVAASGA